MPEFFLTPMGQRFYEGTMMNISRSLEKANELKEVEIEQKDKELKLKEKELEMKEKELQLKEKELYFVEIKMTNEINKG
jgi:ribosomal protein S2